MQALSPRLVRQPFTAGACKLGRLKNPRGAGIAARCSLADQQPTATSHPPTLTRRAGLASAAALLLNAGTAVAGVEVPPLPAIGDCPECIGEVGESLNTCPLPATSCVSTLNDDEPHFQLPWMFDGDREAAVEQLIDVATGGRYEPGLIDTPGGISRADAAAFIAGGVANVVRGQPPPPRPQRRIQAEFKPFDGVLADRHTTPSGCIYVRLVLGTAGGTATEVDDPSSVVDAEFIFPPNDNIVVVRASSRVEPPSSAGKLELSFTQGVVLDRNVARRTAESLRTALRWELAPVLLDFEPRYNPEAPVWFERLFQPFSERNAFRPSYEFGESYPYPEQ